MLPLALSLLVILQPTSFTRQVTAERGHSAEAAGRLVLAGPVLLPPAQTVQHDGDGSSGEPALQQREATAYPPSGSSTAPTHALPHFATCPDFTHHPLPFTHSSYIPIQTGLAKEQVYGAGIHFTPPPANPNAAPSPLVLGNDGCPGVIQVLEPPT